MRSEDLLMLFIATYMFSFLIIRSALKEILKINIGRSERYREILKKQRILERVSLCFIKKNIKKHQLLCNILLSLHYLNIFFIIVFLVIAFFSLLRFKVFTILKTVIIIKLLIIDIPTLIFFVVKTGHDKKTGE